ncbi:MAG: phosphonate metabolism protein/1,5-bisphosphokinase (PRPP-forming) PhnN [Marinobacterium sp.]|nr:phosphonate metabolism protein/1,5-bisphosphokinase (PRPP-forming) PhnN [Marinobacterium sp.]
MSGTLFYLMGASGSGKDSLLAGCRSRLLPFHRCCVAHRYITRAAGVGGENHVHLTEAEFAQRSELGMFAMQWDSHGYRYAIGSELDQWLDSGINVLVNGSREFLPWAMERYDELVPVLIDVNPALLRDRLIRRGRESLPEIEQRLARHTQMLETMPSGTCRIDNSGPLEQGIEALLELVTMQGWRPLQCG